MESYVTFSHLGWACLFVFQMLKPFHTKSEMNKPQTEGNANSHLYSRGHSSNKPFRCAAILDCRRIGHRRRNFTLKQ